MQCEMCGADNAHLLCAVEATQLRLCTKCSRYGRVIREIHPPAQQKATPKKPVAEVITVLVDDWNEKIKKGREAKQLTQKELSLKINEKESLIAAIESAHSKPSDEVAAKLEKFLGIALFESHLEDHTQKAKKSVGGLTIGDLLLARRKQ